MALSGDSEGGGILIVELYRKVRLARRGGMSERAAAVHFGVSRASVKKIMEFSIPPGYRRAYSDGVDAPYGIEMCQGSVMKQLQGGVHGRG